MRTFLLLMLGARMLCGYSWQATVTIPAASTTTQTNTTLAITGSNVKLKTVANGGAIQHTVSRNGVTVPADLVLSSVSGCGSGLYKWDVASYDGTAGTVIMWLLMPSHSSSSSTSIFVCLGSGVATYQGGAVGSAYDSNIEQVYHLEEPSNPYHDFGPNGKDSTAGTYPTQVTGKIGKGQSFASGSSQFIEASNGLASGNTITLACWVNTSTTSVSNYGLLDNRGNGGLVGGVIYIDGAGKPTMYENNVGAVAGGSSIADGNWHFFVGTGASVNLTVYIDGASVAAGGTSPFAGYAAGNFFIGSAVGPVSFSNASLDECQMWQTAWSASYVSTIYNNQNSPPVIGAFSPLSAGTVSAYSILY